MSSKKISIHELPIPMSISEFSGGRISDFNKAWSDMTGLEPDDKVIGKTSIELGFLADISAREILLNEIKLNGYFTNKEVNYTRRDGSILYLLVSCQKVLISGDDYLLTTYQDITRLKSTENSLRISERRYRELVDNARTIIVKMDVDGKFTFVNEYAQAFFGFKLDEILGKTAFETIVPERESTGRKLDTLIESLYRDPDRYSININENIKKNGERVWIEWYNKALFDSGGTRIGHMAVGIDITERKANHDALNAAQEKLALALENANVGLWEWDLTNDKVVWDDRSQRMFGLVPGTFAGTPKAFEELVVEEDLQIIQRSLANSVEKGVPYELVFRIKVKDRIKWISTKASIKRNEDGKPVYMTGVAFDITGFRDKTDKAITRLNDELLRSNKELENFAYVASHDLQEPLRMVTSFTQLLQKRYKDKLDEDANTYIQFAVDGSKRMFELLNGLLAYSRVKTSGKEFRLVKMDDVVNKVQENLRIKLEEQQVILNIESLPEIIADENQMIQLIQNLISNGIKYNERTPEITISCSHTDEENVFTVSDNGIGIESQYFERIFRIFQRLHTREQVEGTGIGLAICKRIVERHHGRIWVESRPGAGSSFMFSIPKTLHDQLFI